MKSSKRNSASPGDARSVSPGRATATVAGVAVAVAALVAGATTLSGCDAESCQQIRDSYQQAVDSEPGLVELSDEGPPHAALAVDLQRLDDWTSDLFEAAVGDGLDIDGTFDIEGQSIPYSVGATGADLRFEASDACAGCLRVYGDLRGDVGVELPFVGTHSAPLSGVIDWTVPLDVGLDDGEAAVFFDTHQAVDMGLPMVEAQLDGLPGEWTEPIASVLLDRLAAEIAEEVEPYRLVGYEMPDLGVGDVQMVPSQIALDADTDTLILGIRTNLAVQVPSRLEHDIVDAMALDDGASAALAVHPRLGLEGVRHAIRAGEIPHRYTLSGDPDDDGPAYVVADNFDIHSHRDDADALAVDLNFRAFNFRSWLACFSMQGQTTSRLAIADGTLEFELEDVDVTGAGGLIDTERWGTAPFVERSQLLISRSLDDDVFSIPGADIDFEPVGFSTEGRMVVVKATDQT